LVEITVSDEGPGIPPREREAIFQPFVRLSGKVTDGVAGTGIGLSIARELARLHGGDLVLRPSEVGACFEVTIVVDDQKGAGP
jgi:signal transduction histidine kinase